jgi:gluconate kinase
MSPTLLASQFATLEPPDATETPLVVDAAQTPAAMCAEALALLAARA